MSNPIAENCGHDHGLEEAPANASAPVEPTSASPEWTPGPWVVDDPARPWNVRGPKGLVARMVYERASDREGNANARLIAAAPNLYAALEAINARLSANPERTLDGAIRDMDWCAAEARAALAKARGQ